MCFLYKMKYSGYERCEGCSVGAEFRFAEAAGGVASAGVPGMLESPLQVGVVVDDLTELLIPGFLEFVHDAFHRNGCISNPLEVVVWFVVGRRGNDCARNGVASVHPVWADVVQKEAERFLILVFYPLLEFVAE